MKLHTLVVRVENKAGVAARITGLFARRGFNIETLAVAPTDDPKFSRFTITVDADMVSMNQVIRQLDKLINVISILELEPSSSIERELMLVKINPPPEKEEEVRKLIESKGAETIDTKSSAFVVAITGTPKEMDSFEHKLRPYGIEELQRTGRAALSSSDEPEAGEA